MTPPETAYFETLQVDTDHPAPRARRIWLWALWALAIALVVGHPRWVAAGMPVPAFLSPMLEILTDV